MSNVTFQCADAFETLKACRAKKRTFDVVILDPPSFTRNKKTVATALRAYSEINGLAASLDSPGGFLITSSCSHHDSEAEFFGAVERALTKAGRQAGFSSQPAPRRTTRRSSACPRRDT